MFDIGFSELMLIGLVALVVIGPERLPRVARTAGHLLGKLQRYVSDVKSDIQREMQLEDLKKLQREVSDSARELETSIRKQVSTVEADLGKTAAEVAGATSVGGDSQHIAGDAPSDAATSAPQLELGLGEQAGASAERKS
jgi:sec-independent protein translocase protein TatB